MKSQVTKINIQENVPLAPFTTFKIGGPARFFVEASSEEEIVAALEYAKEYDLAVFVLAGGSNILVSDDGFNGLVIKIQNSKFKIQNSSLECGAGLLLSELVRSAKDNNLSGLEWAAGIPGTVGGAVRGNAGAYGGEIKDNIESVRVLEVADEMRITDYKKQECDFIYRSSLFKQKNNLIVLSCVLNLQEGESAEIEGKMKEFIQKRINNLPKEFSPGSFFQNPIVNNQALIRKFEHDKATVCRESKIPAAWLIEEAGLKGKKMGGVMVSEKHANFVINLGTGRAQEVIMLASFIKMKIRNEFGVQLKEEVQLVGF